MSRPPAPLPRDLLPAFRRTDAIAHGVGAWRLRGADLERSFRGVRIVNEGPGIQLDQDEGTHAGELWRRRQLRTARAYSLVMPHHYFFCGVTAAAIWELPIPEQKWISELRPGAKDSADSIEVGVLAPTRIPRVTGVTARQFQPHMAAIREHNGMRVLDPASIWATVGPRLKLPDRVALGDAIVRAPRIGGNLWSAPRSAHAAIAELAAVTEVKRRTGRGLLLEALPLIRDGAASAPETHLRLAVIEAGLPEPALDHDVYAPDGRYLGTSECVFEEFRLALEYEGDHHRTSRKQWNRDIEKYQAYREAGWEPIQVTSELLYRRRKELIERIRSALWRRGWRP